VGEWAQGRSWLEVRDRTDGWGLPVSKKKKKWKRRKGGGAAGFSLLGWPGPFALGWPVGCSLFFCSFLFYFLSFVYFRFWIEIKL
jgi:hypothetical protein